MFKKIRHIHREVKWSEGQQNGLPSVRVFCLSSPPYFRHSYPHNRVYIIIVRASAHPVPFYRINFRCDTAIVLSGLFRSAVTLGSVPRSSFARDILRNCVLSPCPVLFGCFVKPCFVRRFWMVKSCIRNV